MLLRESGHHTGVDYDLSGIVNAASAASHIPHSTLLLEYADAFMAASALTDPPSATAAQALPQLRQSLAVAISPEAVIDAAGVVAIFEAVVRIADATGITLEPQKAEKSEDFREHLGIDQFHCDSW